jgi:UDP-glucuronate decarboxylase
VHKIVQEDIELVVNHALPWDKFRGKSILVTGANGFLPSYLVYTLLRLNDKSNLGINVVGLVRNDTKAKNRFGDLLNRKDFQLLVQDVTSPITTTTKFSYIIHAASQASPKFYGVDPVGTAAANTIGTYNLLKLAREHESEGFLFFSTSEVYGTVGAEQIPTKENYYGYIDPTNVRACYAESKRLGETLCASFLHQFTVPVKIVRPFHTYGPGMDLNDGRVYADFIADIVHNRNIKMKSDGTAVRAFCYSADATAGFFTALLKGENGQAYNVGNTQGESSIIALAEKLVNLFPEKKLMVEKWESPDGSAYIPSTVQRNVPDTAKINSLGWQATTDIASGFKRTILSYKA